MEALPYLREIVLKRDQIDDFNQYPFSIPPVRELDSLFQKELLQHIRSRALLDYIQHRFYCHVQPLRLA